MKKILFLILSLLLVSCSNIDEGNNVNEQISLIYPEAVIFNIGNNNSITYEANIDGGEYQDWLEYKFKQLDIKRLEKFDKDRMTLCGNNYGGTFGNEFVKFKLYSCGLMNSTVSIEILDGNSSILYKDLENYPFVCDRNIELNIENLNFYEDYLTLNIFNNSNNTITDWYYNIDGKSYNGNTFGQIVFLDGDKNLKPNEKQEIKIKYDTEKYGGSIEKITITPVFNINNYMCKIKDIEVDFN